MARWEKLTEESAERTDRLRVEGGWLYRTRTIYKGGSTPAMVFVADPSPAKSAPRKSRAAKAAPVVAEEDDDGKPVRWDPEQ